MNRLRTSPLATVAALAVALAGTACTTEDAQLPPPPFSGKPAKLRHPQALALSPNGATLYVAHSAFDHAFSSGVLTSVPVAAFDTGDAAVALADATGTTHGRIHPFPGRLVLSAAGDAAYLTGQDTSFLQRIPLDPGTGAVACTGDDGDCREGAISLGDVDVLGPFALLRATASVPGGPGTESVLLVTHLSPRTTPTGTSTTSGVGFTVSPARVAVIPERLLASGVTDPFGAELTGPAYTVPIDKAGATSLVVGQGGKLWIGGCQERTTATTVSRCSRSTGAQAFVRRHLLREVSLGAGPSAVVGALGLTRYTGGGDTLDMAGSGGGRYLHLGTYRPSMLITLDTAVTDGDLPVLVSAVPLPEEPSRVLVLPRATGDLVVASALRSDTLTVVDPFAGTVVAQLRNVGDGPYDLAAVRTATADRVFVSLFNACGVLAVDVPLDDPGATRVAGRLGEATCP